MISFLKRKTREESIVKIVMGVSIIFSGLAIGLMGFFTALAAPVLVNLLA